MPDERIDNLPFAGPLTGTEPIPVVDGGVTSQSTTQDIADLAPSGFPIDGDSGTKSQHITTDGGSYPGGLRATSQLDSDPTGEFGSVTVQPGNGYITALVSGGLESLLSISSSGSGAADMQWRVGGSNVFAANHDGSIISMTLSGRIKFEDAAYGGYLNDGDVSGSVTVNFAVANVHRLRLTGNITTLTLSNTTTGYACSLTLYLVQDGTGSRTVAWPASVKWPGATAPVLSTPANSIDIVVLETFDGGTTWFANLAGKAYA